MPTAETFAGLDKEVLLLALIHCSQAAKARGAMPEGTDSGSLLSQAEDAMLSALVLREARALLDAQPPRNEFAIPTNDSTTPKMPSMTRRTPSKVPKKVKTSAPSQRQPSPALNPTLTEKGTNSSLLCNSTRASSFLPADDERSPVSHPRPLRQPVISVVSTKVTPTSIKKRRSSEPQKSERINAVAVASSSARTVKAAASQPLVPAPVHRHNSLKPTTTTATAASKPMPASFLHTDAGQEYTYIYRQPSLLRPHCATNKSHQRAMEGSSQPQGARPAASSVCSPNLPQQRASSRSARSPAPTSAADDDDDALSIVTIKSTTSALTTRTVGGKSFLSGKIDHSLRKKRREMMNGP